MHVIGQDMPVNSELARELLQPAVEAEYPPAQLLLGQIYSAGVGVDADQDEAEHLFLLAAENGLPLAQIAVASVATQRGDHTTAIQWLERAMEAGEPAAAARLGVNYQQGNGVPQNNARANELFQIAIDHGSAEGRALLAGSYMFGLGVQQDLFRARALFWEAAQQEYPQAQYFYGVLLLQGQGGPAQPSEGVRFLKMAADSGLPPAQVQLAQVLLSALGTPQDYSEAARYSLLAAEQGSDAGQNQIGYQYELGLGVPENAAEAAIWYRRAADQGQPNAMHSLAGLYLRGDGVEQAPALAYAWLDLAIRHYSPGTGSPSEFVIQLGGADVQARRQNAQRQRDQLGSQLPIAALQRASAFVSNWQAAHGDLAGRASAASSSGVETTQSSQATRMRLARAYFSGNCVAYENGGDKLVHGSVGIFQPRAE